MLNDSDFEEIVDVDYQQRCEKVSSLIRNTTKEEFEEWLAFDNARIRESLSENEPSGMVGKRAVKSGFILSLLPPAYPPYKSGVKKKSSHS